MRVVLLSLYELGRQPFGLASPAAWLRAAGHEVSCADLAVGSLPAAEVREADVVAFYLPMHTATRLAAQAIERVKQLNPNARLCAYGLYAPINAEYLKRLGVQGTIGGEFEAELVRFVAGQPFLPSSLERLPFLLPDRNYLPVLQRYPKLAIHGEKKLVGYTEASRGCKHRCRHCPVVPVYDGQFRVVPTDVVLGDIRQQVAMGAGHISFGDPDFFNGPTHSRKILEAFHTEFPDITYDVTIKIEHLLQQRAYLPLLKQTGCAFVISAVESVDDHVLQLLDKGHSCADFFETVRLFQQQALNLSPTFIPFTPWTSRESYCQLLASIASLGLVEHVAPVQLSLRLLITQGSRLLELADIQSVIGAFDPAALVYRWSHPDSEVDLLASQVLNFVQEDAKPPQASRGTTFDKIWELAHGRPAAVDYELAPRTTIPYLEEPWFC